MELQRLGASLHCAGTESRESRETGSYTTCTTCTTCTRIYFLCCYATLVSCLGSGRRDRCGCSAASPHRSANAPGCQGRLLTGTVLQRLTDRHSHTGGGGVLPPESPLPRTGSSSQGRGGGPHELVTAKDRQDCLSPPPRSDPQSWATVVAAALCSVLQVDQFLRHVPGRAVIVMVLQPGRTGGALCSKVRGGMRGALSRPSLYIITSSSSLWLQDARVEGWDLGLRVGGTT